MGGVMQLIRGLGPQKSILLTKKEWKYKSWHQGEGLNHKDRKANSRKEGGSGWAAKSKIEWI